MTSIDTNILVRIVIRDDEQQAASADHFISRGAWVPVVALTEAIWVLQSVYALTSAELITGIEMLLQHQDLTLQDSDAVEAALKQFRVHPSTEFSDYLMLELARKAGHLPLGTFDRRLARVHGAQKV